MRAMLLVAAMALLAGCATSEEPSSGIFGTVLYGPVCPVEQDPPEPGCEDRPYRAHLEVATAEGGRTVKEFESQADGTFRVAVAPGAYLIRSPSDSSAPPSCASEGFVVAEGRYTEVAVQCDSGIR